MICERDLGLHEDQFGFLKAAALTAEEDEAVIIPASFIAEGDHTG